MSPSEKKTLAEAQQEFADALNETRRLLMAEYLRIARKVSAAWKKQ